MILNPKLGNKKIKRERDIILIRNNIITFTFSFNFLLLQYQIINDFPAALDIFFHCILLKPYILYV